MNNFTDSEHNFNKFIKILNQHNIISIVIAGVIGEQLNEVTSTFVNSIVMPFLKKNDNDTKLENKILHINGMKFNIGRFILIFIKCVAIIYIIFFISKLLKKYK